MNTGSVSGGAGLPLEVMQLMNELGREVHDESRSSAKDAARRALEKGHEEAHEIREQAKDMRTGSVLGATLTLAGAGLQAYGASGMGEDATAIELKRADTFVAVGGTTAQLGENIGGIAQASGKFDEADARQAAADAEAANQRAESEQAEAAEAQKLVDRARDTYGQLLSLEHASMMAAIGGRA